ncbi:deleted in azoospermia-like isoform X1 [Hippocampus zosterae]|uniref:deleted in azoospermia-like isoform X1 n=1 Tax=Hippocampus zosterae TaxID=109293 RepID=UPI00223DADB8|nr:deleted in azoospermia-like isoform X1 [Hippocampus zosterae]
MNTQTHHGSSNQSFLPFMSNGYTLPEGQVTPNAIFVGGIDTGTTLTEMKDFFSQYGPIKDVKIITYRGGFSKGYGFVYFTENVDVKPILEQRIFWKGKALKLGPAIIKRKSCRMRTSQVITLEPWSPSQVVICSCCSSSVGSVNQSSTLFGSGTNYFPSYTQVQSEFGNHMQQQMGVNSQTAYTYEYSAPYWTTGQRTRTRTHNFVHCGAQTALQFQQLLTPHQATGLQITD